MVEQRATPTVGAASHPLILSNRSLAPTERPASATVLFVDTLRWQPDGDSLNVERDDLVYVKRELPRFLKKLQPGDAVAIYVLTGPTVRVIHEFSEDPESLIRSVERIPSTAFKKLGDGQIEAEWTLAALESIALHLADIPGRKTLLWISGAFPITFGFSTPKTWRSGPQMQILTMSD